VAEHFPLQKRRVPPLPPAEAESSEVLRAQARAIQSIPPSVRGFFSDAELLELKHGFDQVDADGSDAIDGQELHTALASAGGMTGGVTHGDVTRVISLYAGRGKR